MKYFHYQTFFSNPTPKTDELIETIWTQYDSENEDYMDIGVDLQVKQHHNQGRMQIWHDYQKRFTGHI